jgi:hypothetical protein
MDEASLLEDEGMSEPSRSLLLSRKTGYEIFVRCKQDGLDALTDRSQRPVRHDNQPPDPVQVYCSYAPTVRAYCNKQCIVALTPCQVCS